ncbi:SHOCT domain-containing protein [Candidatus Soleaferrea massiliensis]|uniref:SHOCT domain-containing protein n=1 Tax=Candidatus Soleaferrea massiliensis TaxID=1470354 RepID=UPI0005909920|nr:SHOCT domain-containing protein [Candidatus Soleaferrea massiliensis]
MNTFITMTKEQFERELNYQVTISVARILIMHGLLNAREFGKIDTILIKKYRPIIGGLQIKSS